MEENKPKWECYEDMLRRVEIEQKGKPFFMRNSNWYYYDYAQHKYVLKDNVPNEAIQSYKEFTGEEDPYEYQEVEDNENPYK